MKHSRLFYPLTFICSFVYFASYLTRLNYQVMIAAVAEAEQLAKSTVSLAVTALFISYGLGQLLAGVLGDKAEPETLILAGLGGSVVINFLMPLVPGVTARTALWGINGLFQAMIWPPAVRLLSANLDNKEYEKAVFWMNTAAMIANILMYLLIPVLIRRAGVAAWRAEFGISAGVGAAVAVLFLVVSLKLRGNKTAAKDLPGPEHPALEKNKIRLVDILPFVIIGMAVQGLLRDGITTWTPSFLNETFGLNVADSILLTILLPVSAIVFYRLAAILLKRIGGNEPFCCALLFVILTAAALLLLTAGRRGPVFSAVLLMICTGISHAINYVLVCIAPNRFKGGRVAWIAGLFNFSVYVGSASSTFGFAKLAEGRGWFFTIGTWVVMAVIGAASCGFIAAKWQTRFMNRVK